MGAEPIRLTPRGRLLSAVGTGALLAGALTLSLPIATLGLVVVAYVSFARLSLGQDLSASQLRVRREAPGAVRVGESAEVRLDATEARVPEGLSIEIADDVPDGLRAQGPTRVATGSSAAYAITGTARGTSRFATIRARVVDRRGLWEGAIRLPVLSVVEVLPSLAPLAAGRRLARRPPTLDLRHPHAAAILMQELDHETIREFQSGDRLRDVDWKRLSVFQELFTKTRERERPDSVMIILDASRTMRARVGDGPARLEHAAEVAVQLAHLAGSTGHRVGYLVMDQGRVLAHARAARRGDVAAELLGHLGRLPRPLRLARRPDVASGSADVHDPAEAPFLARARGEREAGANGPVAPAADGARNATHRLAGLLHTGASEKVVAVMLTDLESDGRGVVKLAGRLVAEGDRVAVALLPGARYLAPPADPTLRDLENAYRERSEREAGARRLRALGARVVELGPLSDADGLRRQMAGTAGAGGRRG